MWFTEPPLVYWMERKGLLAGERNIWRVMWHSYIVLPKG